MLSVGGSCKICRHAFRQLWFRNGGGKEDVRTVATPYTYLWQIPSPFSVQLLFCNKARCGTRRRTRVSQPGRQRAARQTLWHRTCWTVWKQDLQSQPWPEVNHVHCAIADWDAMMILQNVEWTATQLDFLYRAGFSQFHWRFVWYENRAQLYVCITRQNTGKFSSHNSDIIFTGLCRWWWWCLGGWIQGIQTGWEIVQCALDIRIMYLKVE